MEVKHTASAITMGKNLQISVNVMKPAANRLVLYHPLFFTDKHKYYDEHKKNISH